MELLDAIKSRRSISRLSPPGPTATELHLILDAAACAPDHGTLRPWRFIVLRDDAKDAFGPVLAAATEAEYRDRGVEPEPAKVQKDLTKMDRAPLVVVVVCAYQPNEKIPRSEQHAAVVAAAQNACLAATDLGYGSMWRTGPNAYNPHVKRALGVDEDCDIVGFLYFGTVDEAKAKAPNDPDLEGIVTHWTPPS
jgi:nitroreductase